jgi:hypothetical protein
MNIIKQCDIFGVKEVVYTDPVTRKVVVIQCDDFNQGEEHANKRALINACIELYSIYEDYYHDILKFSDIKSKAKQIIKESRRLLHIHISDVYKFTRLEDLAAHVYENIYPFLATCPNKLSLYRDLIQFIEYHSLNYSNKHQLSSII